ncbi:UNVERIFIED_CONTAM: hypothetical protein Sradi_3261600 [Sesamum radiatum]|uniref:CCHC-type domain-containing protein n=1 Tax=Sesamum radiatum TaxID=300843 RepID=A0AAW2R0V6_SESRA
MVPMTAPSKSSIFIGNIPLFTSKLVNGDNIAAAFNNSSRKTLSYVAPMIQNDEVIVRPTLEINREGARCWASTAVGYFLGRNPYFPHLNEFLRYTRPAIMEANGGEAPCRVDVEYEWLPPKCTACSSLGHRTKECPILNRSSKPLVQIYVQKPRPPPQYTSPNVRHVSPTVPNTPRKPPTEQPVRIISGEGVETKERKLSYTTRLTC